ncbi:MAG TPA: pyridoxamine 5'-phosphate oxidase [Phycisphaerae bacterium]
MTDSRHPQPDPSAPPRSLRDLRREYESEGLHEADMNPDPFKEFARWFDEACSGGLLQPDAMTLATATPDGRPSARMVLLKHFDERGFVFYTNYHSRKGRELAQNPYAALVFYWPELDRQVRISGTVQLGSREESEAYFRTRPLGAQLSACASEQSEMVESRGVLEARVRALLSESQGKDVPCPDNWGSYRLIPDEFEFWQGRIDRLHDRLRYRCQPDRTWRIERLAP